MIGRIIYFGRRIIGRMKNYLFWKKNVWKNESIEIFFQFSIIVFKIKYVGNESMPGTDKGLQVVEGFQLLPDDVRGELGVEGLGQLAVDHQHLEVPVDACQTREQKLSS